ncbi:MAG: heme o synthase [Gammaproteobacteria bacterium]
MPPEPVATALNAAALTGSRAARAARLAFSVFKPRIALEITLTAIAGAAVTPGRPLSLGEVLALALAVFLSAGAAGAYNQVMEPDVDRVMLRTRRRPFATGQLVPGRLWLVVIAGLTVFSVVLAATVLNVMAAVQVLLGSLTYGYIYTAWLKRRTWLNIVIGGLAGSFAALAGSAAVDPGLPAAAWVFAAALFFWTPPHFWSLAFYGKQDYARAGIPMLPNLMGDRPLAIVVLAHTVILVALTLLPALVVTGWFYTLCAVAGGAYFIWTSIVFVRAPTRGNAMANFHGSLWQLGLLLLGAIASGVLSGHLAA